MALASLAVHGAAANSKEEARTDQHPGNPAGSRSGAAAGGGERKDNRLLGYAARGHCFGEDRLWRRVGIASRWWAWIARWRGRNVTAASHVIFVVDDAIAIVVRIKVVRETVSVAIRHRILTPGLGCGALIRVVRCGILIIDHGIAVIVGRQVIGEQWLVL